jgi:hypothetical protein
MKFFLLVVLAIIASVSAFAPRAQARMPTRALVSQLICRCKKIYVPDMLKITAGDEEGLRF